MYPLKLNFLNVARTNYTLKAYNINLIGNSFETELRAFTLSNDSSNVSINSPLSNIKYFDNVPLYANISAMSMLSNVSYYLDGEINNSVSMTFRGSFNWAEEIQNLTLGKHNITYSYLGSCGIFETKYGGEFYWVKNYTQNVVEKEISYENSGLYNIKIKTHNILGNNVNITTLDFVDITLNPGSWSPFYTFSNLTSNGEYFGWTDIYVVNEKKQYNYSVAGVGNRYTISKGYVIGLD